MQAHKLTFESHHPLLPTGARSLGGIELSLLGQGRMGNKRKRKVAILSVQKGGVIEADRGKFISN